MGEEIGRRDPSNAPATDKALDIARRSAGLDLGISQPSPGDGLQTQLMKNETLARPARKVLVEALASTALELVEVAPRLDQLDALLAERPIESDTDRELAAVASTSGLYSRADLSRLVQASEAELERALVERGAVELDGFVRRVSEAYQDELLQVLLLTIVSQGHTLARVGLLTMHECLPSQAARVSGLTRLASRSDRRCR